MLSVIALEDTPLLCDLSVEQIGEFKRLLDTQTFERHDYILRAGDDSEKVFRAYPNREL